MNIALQIKEAAIRNGFDACGITKPVFFEQDAFYLAQWLSQGRHGTMNFMSNYSDKRADVRLLMEDVCSVIVVLMNYYTDKRQQPDVPQVAKYAYGIDYHYVVKERLKKLLKEINECIIPCSGRFFCDSAPLFERRLAQSAGLGWIGKNTQLINPKIGSYCFIGELLVDVPLPYDRPMVERCGKCKICLDSCPASAFIAPHQLDASRCISYKTIEFKGLVDSDSVADCGNRLFGCDTCLDVCPWNRKAKSNNLPELQPEEHFLAMKLDDWKHFSRSDFKRMFKKSPLQRAGYCKLRSWLDMFFNPDNC